MENIRGNFSEDLTVGTGFPHGQTRIPQMIGDLHFNRPPSLYPANHSCTCESGFILPVTRLIARPTKYNFSAVSFLAREKKSAR